MNFLNKMERKYGKYAIRNLSAYIIAFYVAGYLMSLFSPAILSYLTLEPYYILKGQIWRIVSWLLIPPQQLSLFTIFMLLLYYSLGNALERTWGTFRYNVYIISGIAAMVVGSFIIYFVMRAVTGNIPLFSQMFNTYYINMSIFLAFAMTYPNMEVLLYFLIPVKVKWIGILYAVLLLADFVRSGIIGKVVILISMLNFIVYFFSNRDVRRFSYKEQKRRRDFQKSVNPQRPKKGAEKITRHKCAVCGRTELDGDHLEFRFCSKCDGNYEYCQDHLFTHEHVKHS